MCLHVIDSTNYMHTHIIITFKGGQCLLTIQGWVQVALCH